MSDDSQARFRAALRNPDAVEPRPGAMDERNTMVWFGPAGRMMPLWQARSWTKSAINEMDFPTEPPPEETEQARPDTEEAEGAEEAEVREVECDDEDAADEETLQEILAAIEALSARMLAVEEMRAERRALDAETEAALARQDKGPAEALAKLWTH
jgi:hypothetical protein